jgi:hypothetical protein
MTLYEVQGEGLTQLHLALQGRDSFKIFEW